MTTCALSKTLAVAAHDHLLFSSDQRGETHKGVMDHWFYCEILTYATLSALIAVIFRTPLELQSRSP